MMCMLKRSTRLGTFLFLFLGTSAYGQEKAKDAPKQEMKEEVKLQPKLRSLVRAGYTRPGNPADKLGKNGAIMQVALDPAHTGFVIGATVYFAVFKMAEDDVVRGDLAGLADAFVAGRSFENSISPGFDRKAKYLYVYQVVNDRGLNPTTDGGLAALDRDVNTAHISSFALRLVVDPRYITSWGHFSNLGFEALVADRKIGKDGAPGAADDIRVMPMAFSSNPAIVRELPFKRFQERCPAYGLGNLLNGFGVDKSNMNLEASSAYAGYAKRKADAKQLNWVTGAMEAAVAGGRTPDFVQLVYDNFLEGAEGMADARYIGDTIFRVDFQAASALKVGQHSVVFGFTSDLPPTEEVIRVEGMMAAGLKVEGKGVAAAVALGTCLTPIGGGVAPPVGAAVSGLIGGGTIGGGGFGAPFFPLPGALFGAARAPSSAGASGSGQGSNSGNQAQQQAQNQQSPNTINFSATLINQQAQAQAQAQLQFQIQAQQQHQSQRNNNRNHHNHHNHHGHVVPEPSTIIAGLLGMPALYFFRRRARMQSAPVS